MGGVPDPNESDATESDVSIQSEIQGVKSKFLKEFDLLTQGRQDNKGNQNTLGNTGRGCGGRGGAKRGVKKQGTLESFVGMNTRGKPAAK